MTDTTSRLTAKTQTYEQELAEWQERRLNSLRTLAQVDEGERAVDLMVRNAWRGGDFTLVYHPLTSEGVWIDDDAETVFFAEDVAAYRRSSHDPKVKAHRDVLTGAPGPAPACVGALEPVDVWLPGAQPGHVALCQMCTHPVRLERQGEDSAVMIPQHDTAGRPL